MNQLISKIRFLKSIISSAKGKKVICQYTLSIQLIPHLLISWQQSNLRTLKFPLSQALTKCPSSKAIAHHESLKVAYQKIMSNQLDNNNNNKNSNTKKKNNNNSQSITITGTITERDNVEPIKNKMENRKHTE